VRCSVQGVNFLFIDQCSSITFLQFPSVVTFTATGRADDLTQLNVVHLKANL